MLPGRVGNSTRLEFPTRPRTAPGGELPDSVLILAGFRQGRDGNNTGTDTVLPPRPRAVPDIVLVPGRVSHPVSMRIALSRIQIWLC